MRDDFIADNLHRDAVALSCHTHHPAVDVDLDAFALQDVCDRQGDIFIFPGDKMRRELNDGYLAAEAAINLRKLKSDIAAAENDQMRREEVHVHNRAVGEIVDLIKTRNGRRQRPPSDIDEYPLGLQDLAFDLN